MPSKITAQAIKELRDHTGARMMDCKKALEQAQGDFKQAVKIVEDAGLNRAEKNQDRDTTAGLIASYVHTNGKIGAMVELQCETDFVAKNDEFKDLARNIAMQVVAMKPQDLSELLQQEYIKDPSFSIESLIKSLSGKIGEKMLLARFERFELGDK